MNCKSSALQVLLGTSLPKVLILEVNTHIPPPFRFSITRVPDETPAAADVRIKEGLFGCSLSHQAGEHGWVRIHRFYEYQGGRGGKISWNRLCNKGFLEGPEVL